MSDVPRDKLAKLLRMLTSSHEGEVLAAANRINAIVTAHDLDWDTVLAGGPALTEGQMREIYDCAYGRGFTDGKAEGARDWTPAAGTSAEAGHDIERLGRVLDAAVLADQANLLTEFETECTESMRARVDRYGSRTLVSEKQWGVLDRLERKLSRQGLI